MNILQQQKRDSILTLSDQETSPFHQAEKEASQRLMNMIPYKTGQPKGFTSTPTTPALVSATYNRHSIALGDTDDYNTRMFPSSSSSTSLSSVSGLYAPNQMNGNGSHHQHQQLSVPHPTTTHSTSLVSPRTAAYPRSTRSRPASGIDIDSSPDFFSSWRSSMVGSIGGDRASIIDQPKPAEGNDSTTSLVSGNGGGSGFQPWGSTSSFGDININSPYSDKPLPRIATVAENEEESQGLAFDHAHQRSPMMRHAGSFSTNTTPPIPPAKIAFKTTVASPPQPMSSTSSSTSTSAGLSPASAFAKYYSAASQMVLPPVPSASTSASYSRPSSSPNSPKPTTSSVITTSGMDKNFGTFLDPKGAWADDHDCFSDHSETSHRSSRSNRSKHAPSSKSMNKSSNKDKKSTDITVDMELLKDVPAWFRSLRLHKYNNIFAPMRWQDIIQLSDQDLQDKGVAALGARRKMVKVFQTIQDYCKANDISF
ncbi:unnamed protein product [Absidia cylindrospora]